VTANLTFYDAAYPPANPPATDGVAFYIGGDTPHVWTIAEINAATPRYRLPIYVRSNPASAIAAVDVQEALSALHNIGAPKGCLVAWDTETAADTGYMAVVYTLIVNAGYKLIDYGSQSNLFANQLPVSGYYWGAEWDGASAVLAGDAGTQYADDGAYDLDVFKPGLPFWDTHGSVTPTPPVPPAPPVPTNWQEKIMQQLPTLKDGNTGNAVETVQGLCGARGWPVTIDGIFGPNTENAVKLVQGHAGITMDGIVGPQTWAALLGVA
jgi:peptidoglycan hydrolase-like protein with peptidoglycan-binding domain